MCILNIFCVRTCARDCACALARKRERERRWEKGIPLGTVAQNLPSIIQTSHRSGPQLLPLCPDSPLEGSGLAYLVESREDNTQSGQGCGFCPHPTTPHRVILHWQHRPRQLYVPLAALRIFTLCNIAANRSHLLHVSWSSLASKASLVANILKLGLDRMIGPWVNVWRIAFISLGREECLFHT